jgi:hypothetical protein
MDTHDNPDMCGRLLTQRGGVMRVSKNMALSINRCPKRKAESPVLVFEKDGHLQLCLFDNLASGGSRMRGPHRLRDYSAPIHDAAVK